MLIALGVYPFVVPFVPVGGTPLALHRPPSADFMRAVLEPLGEWLTRRRHDFRQGEGGLREMRRLFDALHLREAATYAV